MKRFGKVTELALLFFRKSGFAVTVEPSSASADTTFQLPAAGGGTKSIATADSSTAFTNKTFDADGTGNSLTNVENADIKVGAAIDAAKIHDGSISNAEFGQLNGVASAILGKDDAGTFTNKTIAAGSNTITGLTKNDVGLGNVDNTSDATKNAAVAALTNKTIDGDVNTVQDLPETALKTNITNATKFFTRDASGVPESATKAVPAGAVLGTTDAQVVTAKDIDGGTASNTSRLTIPKAAKATLDGLTRKQGTLVYASDTNVVYSDDGSNLNELGAGGISTTITQASHGFTASDKGAPLYLNGSVYTKASAVAANTAEVVGVVADVLSVNQFKLVAAGSVTVDTTVSGGALVAGTVYFLHPSNAGQITATEPSASGAVSLPLGVAKDTSTLYLRVMRGAIVNGSAVRKSVALNNNATTTILDVSVSYEAGEMSGWVSIAATSSLRFYVQAQFSKNGAATDWNLAYQTTGDTPPSGFSMSITSAGVIQLALPSITGFSSASLNYAMNVPLYGVTASTASSSSGINYISANSDFEAGTTAGWATYADSAATAPVDGTGGSPAITLAASTASPLRGSYSGLITKDAANRQGQGVSFDFSIAAADKGRPLLITWEGSASANYTGSSGTEYMSVYVYDVTNATLITPASTTVAPGVSKGSTFFVATTSTSYRLIFHTAGTGTSAWTYTIDTVSVGPQSIAIGTAPPTSEVRVAGAGAGAAGHGSTNTKIRRFTTSVSSVGNGITWTDSATLGSYFTINEAGVYAISYVDGRDTGTGYFGISLNSTQLTTSIDAITEADRLVSGYVASGIGGDFSVTKRLAVGDVIRAHTNGNNDPTSTDQVQFIITHLAVTANNVTLADRAVEEYASNSSTSDADDTTSFSYGPAGASTPGPLTATREKRVRFQYPIQVTDTLILEFQNGSGKWAPLTNYDNYQTIQPFSRQNTTYYGMGINGQVINSTDIGISFGAFQATSGATYASSGTAWATSTGKWRVRKVSGGATVGYPVGSQNLVGRTDGVAPGVGYIGQVLEQAITTEKVTVSANTYVDSSETLTLTAGSWRIEYTVAQRLIPGAATTNVGAIALATSGNVNIHTSAQRIESASSGHTFGYQSYGFAYVNISASTTYKLRIINNQASGTSATYLLANAAGNFFSDPTTTSYIRAVRIA